MTNAISRHAIVITITALVAAAQTTANAGIVDDISRQLDHERVIVVLVDKSASIPAADRAIYAESLGNIAATMQTGDRLLVCAIGDDTRSDFRPLLDITVPPSDVRLVREAALRTLRAKIRAQIPALIGPSAHPARYTMIRDSITSGAEAYGSAPHARPYLILMTDAVDEDPTLNMARHALSPAEIDAAVRQSRAASLLPDTHGIGLQVHIVGAGGKYYPANQAFWTAYWRASGATLVSYGRLPLRAL